MTVSVESVLAFLLRCLESGELGVSDALRFAPKEKVLDASVEKNHKTASEQLTFDCYRSHLACLLPLRLPFPGPEARRGSRRAVHDASGVEVGPCHFRCFVYPIHPVVRSEQIVR